MSQVRNYITIDSVINDYIDESEQSVHKYAKLYNIAYRGMEKLGLDFFYKIKSVKIAIDTTNFNTPVCPVYQNVTAEAVTDPSEIKENLKLQLTAPVKWTQTVKNMLAGGATSFTEVGPGSVLQGLIKKVDRQVETKSA